MTTSKPYATLVRNAITELKERGGSSYQAIEKRIGDTGGPMSHTHIMRALKNGVEDGSIVSKGNKYKLSEKTKTSLKRSGTKTASSKKTSAKGRKKKDPNAPKRALSAYMYFAQAARPGIKEENPEASFGETGKLIAAAWANVTAKDKKKYEAQAAKDKLRWQEEKEEYEKTKPASVPGEKKEKGSGKRKKKDPNAPKRSLSAYMYFAQAARPGIVEENPELSFGGIGKAIAAAWKAIGSKDKKKYEALAAKDKIRYEKAKEAYAEKKKEVSGEEEAEEEEEEVAPVRKSKTHKTASIPSKTAKKGKKIEEEAEEEEAEEEEAEEEEEQRE